MNHSSRSARFTPLASRRSPHLRLTISPRSDCTIPTNSFRSRSPTLNFASVSLKCPADAFQTSLVISNCARTDFMSRPRKSVVGGGDRLVSVESHLQRGVGGRGGVTGETVAATLNTARYVAAANVLGLSRAIAGGDF